MLELLTLAIYFLSLFIFSFVFWRKLREDYTNEQIFSLTLSVFVASLLGLWIANSFLPELAFLSMLVFGGLTCLFFFKRYTLKFFEVIDAFAISWFYFAFFSWFATAIGRWGEFSNFGLPEAIKLFPDLILSTFLIYFYYFAISRYRRFSWYQSGKIGFTGLFTLSIFFLGRAAIEGYHLLGNLDLVLVLNATINLVLSGVLAVMLYLRARTG